MSVTACAGIPSSAPARSSSSERVSSICAATGELAVQQAGKAHDGVHVARTDRGPLLEHDLQQPLHGGDLRVEMGEHVGGERVGFHERGPEPRPRGRARRAERIVPQEGRGDRPRV